MFGSITKFLTVCAAVCCFPIYASADEAKPLPPTIYPNEIEQSSTGFDVMSAVPMVASAAAGSATVMAANALTGGALLAPMIGAQTSALYGGNLLGSQASALAAPLVEYSGVLTNSVISGGLYAGSFFAVSSSLGPETDGEAK